MKLQQILIFFGILSVLILGYIFGYYRATKNTEFMLSTNSAMLSIATLNYLEKNELDKISSIHNRGIEESVAAIKGAIEMEKYQISTLRNLYYYHELYDINGAERKRISNDIFNKYERYTQ